MAAPSAPVLLLSLLLLSLLLLLVLGGLGHAHMTLPLPYIR